MQVAMDKSLKLIARSMITGFTERAEIMVPNIEYHRNIKVIDNW